MIHAVSACLSVSSVTQKIVVGRYVKDLYSAEDQKNQGAYRTLITSSGLRAYLPKCTIILFDVKSCQIWHDKEGKTFGRPHALGITTKLLLLRIHCRRYALYPVLFYLRPSHSRRS